MHCWPLPDATALHWLTLLHEPDLTTAESGLNWYAVTGRELFTW